MVSEELLECFHFDLEQDELEEECLGDFAGGEDLGQQGLPVGRES